MKSDHILEELKDAYRKQRPMWNDREALTKKSAELSTRLLGLEREVYQLRTEITYISDRLHEEIIKEIDDEILKGDTHG